MIQKMLQLSDLRDVLCRRRTAVYEAVKDGLLTKPVHFGRSSAWPENEIDAIQRAHLAGKSEEEIRALVANLHQARTADEL